MTDPHKILLVDDDVIIIAALGKILQGCGQLQFATSGADALRLAKRSQPDLVILDLEMPGLDGFEVFAAMKEVPHLADVPVIFLTGNDAEEQEIRGLALGAADFIVKPPRPVSVLARVRMQLRMKDMADALRRAAYTDGLTGIANRRQFDDMVQREWQRAERAASPTAMLMVDIDAFKRYNDHYGHQAGDRCLQAVAQTLRNAAHRPADLAARYGGEEFALVLPDTDRAGASRVAQNLLLAVQALDIPHAASPVAPQVTVSVGVSSHDQHSDSWVGRPLDSRFGNLTPRHGVGQLIRAADQALYAAKSAGRCQAWYQCIDRLDQDEGAVALEPLLGGRERASFFVEMAGHG